MVLIQELNIEDLKEMIQPRGINPDKFHSVIVPASWFCQIHQISISTLRRWIGSGLVEPEPMDNPSGNIKFRLSYVLQFDTAKIKNKMYTSKSFQKQ